MAKKIFVTTGVVATDTPSAQRYMQEIKKTKLLTVEEEKELAVRAQNGDQIAISKMIECNLRFVVQVAKQYQGMGVSLEDLIQFGNLGLFEAVKRFDPTRGVRFISFAVWYVRAELQSALNDHSRTVRIPSHKTSTEDYSVTSIHSPVGEDEGSETYADRFLPAEKDKALSDLKDLKDMIATALSKLKPKEAAAVTLFYGIDQEYAMVMEDIATALDVTGERARQLVRAGEASLKKVSGIKLLELYL